MEGVFMTHSRFSDQNYYCMNSSKCELTAIISVIIRLLSLRSLLVS